MEQEQRASAPDIAALAGEILLASGAEIFRVEETIDRICRAYGVGIYWTAYYLVTDRSALASQQGSVTLRSAVAIVLGILLVLELPQGLFRRLAGPFLRA